AAMVARLFNGFPMTNHLRRVLLVLCAIGLSACASTGPTIAPRSVATIPAPQLTQDSILSAINKARRDNGGHKALAYNSALEAACRTQLKLMVEKDQLAHDLGIRLRDR